jgi:type VI secretion system secreted protein Hcp
MASDIFAKIGDIKGESLDDKHKDEIDVMSYSWGVTQTGTIVGGGGGEGKAQFSDFSFTTNTSKASPALFLACASGQHIRDATISVRKADGGKAQSDYIIVKMTDVLISSYQPSGSSGEERPTESISMAFAKVEFTYIKQDAKGGAEETFSAGWDLKANQKV